MITDFEIRDHGVLPLDCIPAHNTLPGYEYSGLGCGTDAESALDDLLETLSANFDASDLEGRIKWAWNPSGEEGDGESMYWFGIVFNGDE